MRNRLSRQPDHGQRREHSGLRQQQMVHRDHHLFRIEPKLAGHLFQRADRSAIDVCLADVAQTVKSGCDPIAFE